MISSSDQPVSSGLVAKHVLWFLGFVITRCHFFVDLMSKNMP